MALPEIEWHESWGPTLGPLIGSWIIQHCVVPDGLHAGEPFTPTAEQYEFLCHHYRVRPEAEAGQLAPAFVFRRSQLVRPQKWGKGPLTAAQVCVEGVGPALFDGWAEDGDVYECSTWGCRCGWAYAYEPGEPKGRRWPTPLIQITATSEDQTDNIYDALRPMIDDGPLHALIPKTGEEFIRLPGGGRIDVVTSNARSRLGQRVTFVPQDETGQWTTETGMVKVAETQRRGLAGMGGRAVETTNAWDKTEQSVAQRTAEALADDIYRDHILPPSKLSYGDKRERRRIHAHVYKGSWWVDLDAIAAEAEEIYQFDPGQAERFFGNRPVAGAGAAFDPDTWASLERPDYVVPDGALVTIGVDGARFHDALAIVGTELETGHQFVINIQERPETADDDYEHDADEADGALVDIFERLSVWRVYVDPQWIDHLLDRWLGRWGDKKIFPWFTNRPKPIGFALRSYKSAQTSDDHLTHDGDEVMARHIRNARKRAQNAKDDEGRPLWTLAKDHPQSPLKIDAAMAGCLSWEARGDAIAAGALKPKRRAVGYTF